MSDYPELQEMWGLFPQKDGTYAIYGLPYARIAECYPEFRHGEREPIIVSRVEAKMILLDLAQAMGYTLVKETIEK